MHDANLPPLLPSVVLSLEHNNEMHGANLPPLLPSDVLSQMAINILFVVLT